jgi:hypothetical protein
MAGRELIVLASHLATVSLGSREPATLCFLGVALLECWGTVGEADLHHFVFSPHLELYFWHRGRFFGFNFRIFVRREAWIYCLGHSMVAFLRDCSPCISPPPPSQPRTLASPLPVTLSSPIAGMWKWRRRSIACVEVVELRSS